ncbi:ABC transporter permease [Tellurirhabdus rosea]|uniref:ABC transporter permease n=1 Tax=Tellurirhabdus rosea TaxID=2674997 RepID=UPI0022567B16|nr:FtsX-like permease family protein [Tellurirhabdus rosea]
MNVPLWIARRYFFSRRKRSFISLISLISMLGVGVGTMALVVVLSVFNGMEELNRAIFKTFDPDLTVLPRDGKRLAVTPKMLQTIQQTDGVEFVTQVIEDNALARYGNGQMVVKVKGVDNSFLRRREMDTTLTDGRLRLMEESVQFANVAEGVRLTLLISPEDVLTPLELWYPKNNRSINLLSEDSFSQQYFTVSGVFNIERSYDNYVIVPLSSARQLVGYGPTQLSKLETQLRPGTDVEELKETLQRQLGESVRVQTRDDLNADLLRAIRFEKLFVTVTLAFLVLVAGINIFFSLSMLAIEKKDDVEILVAMGAEPGFIRRIFLAEGAIVALTGAVVGLILGVGICLLQERYGFVSMGMQNSLIDAYPVKLEPGDLALTTVIVVLVTFFVSWIPARRASRRL